MDTVATSAIQALVVTCFRTRPAAYPPQANGEVMPEGHQSAVADQQVETRGPEPEDQHPDGQARVGHGEQHDHREDDEQPQLPHVHRAGALPVARARVTAAARR